MGKERTTPEEAFPKDPDSGQIEELVKPKEYPEHLGKTLKQLRGAIPLTLTELSAKSGVSLSHLARIERGQRFPSAHTLSKIAKPLGFEESDLFTLAGYLGGRSYTDDESYASYSQDNRLDPYVRVVLSQKPVEIQRAAVTVISVLEAMAKSIAQEESSRDIKRNTGTTLSSANPK